MVFRTLFWTYIIGLLLIALTAEQAEDKGIGFSKFLTALVLWPIPFAMLCCKLVREKTGAPGH